MNAAVSTSLADRLAELGGIDERRIRLQPEPGQANVEDLEAANENEDKNLRCELIDHTLVEKAMGYEASVVAARIIAILSSFLDQKKLGLISGADGFFQLLNSSVRGPDVAFVSLERLSSAKTLHGFPQIAPDLAVEVLSPGNTRREMSRKRIEYFHSGVKLVWIVDCQARNVAVYTNPDAVKVLGQDETITGGEVLPGFNAQVAEFFTDLDLLNA